ncbi:glycosyl hydrolase family 95 catalytic domain-containing protein [Flavobacterium sp. S87F.05.LMB.W.Kidney.N]|uniref:glycoside hydrolase family 95 protein n=1 Tax=Flavobacterium sp. S87F.05.LMB.W.Kidney.N TaxID=1278758 RepID=UPI0010DD612C|nr:glycoside hydrolase N-terminal domain-containing protein [Flavobacterium sp. S87F.05.LMB.W.Kidney.N]TDX12829.1 alpha-L-fucosidase 2 [Flavobacterium sp. S87F.05.LMB.W.Kidney.N]
MMLYNLLRKSFLLLFLFRFVGYAQDLKLQYNQPAVEWTEALPIGNGTLGAMVFGRIDSELIQLNEATLWSGGPVQKNVNPDAFKNLALIREALTNEDFEKAYALTKNMQGAYSESFMPLGDLILTHDFEGQKAASYNRSLDLQTGLASTSFNIKGVNYKREIFASAPAQCIVIKLSADQLKKLSVTIDASSLLRNQKTVQNQSVVLKGKAPSHVDPNYIDYNKEPIVYEDASGCRGMRFELIIKPVIKDGVMNSDGNKLVIKNASEILLFVSAATSFNGFDKCPDSEGKDEHKFAENPIKKAVTKKYDNLLKDHVADFQHFFNRVSLKLNEKETDKSNLPTDTRLEQYAKGEKDTGLEALFFQFGRYLLISCSRTHNVPANLQGIWNNKLRAPWSSNYTTNINLQMNYWPVESGSLSELFFPLDEFIKNVSVTGTETAKSYYHANGWVVHHNSDIWAMTNPVGDFGKGDPMWANWYMGANWLSRHLWEHYEYTGDKEYLKKVYPIIKGAAEFSLDWLQKNKDGYLVTMPSTSPENKYFYDGKKQGTVTTASTMDIGIIKDLFENTVKASKVLGTDLEFRQKVNKASDQLLPFQIGNKGQLLEWYKDFEEEDPHHRHTSHLYALHPANLIAPLKTPDLAAAAKKTLELRGDDGTGWSLAWKVNMWARLLDGNHAYRLFKNQLRLTKENNTEYSRHGGCYPNLFDAHPPFQIDGNFAGTAGVIEMLMQSQNKKIHLLPALPDSWTDGAIKGITAKGNFTVDIKWNDGKMSQAKIVSNKGGICAVRAGEPFVIEKLNIKSEKSSIGYTVVFETKKGTSYTIKPVN